MSLLLRPSNERGRANHGWLDSRHTFSFADFYDPANMGFSDLRVINEDRVEPGAGFGTHSHRNMEIISYVISGALEHKDSMGNGSVIRPGDVQVMSAGTGVRHSEYNPSSKEPAHFLQIWIMPDRENAAPRYDQREFPQSERQDTLRLIVSGDGRDGSLSIHQDADIYASTLAPGATVEHEFKPGRSGWAQVVKGAVTVNGVEMKAGDELAAEAEGKLHVAANGSGAEILLFDLAA